MNLNEQNNKKLKRIKLNYMSATTRTEPVARIPVNGARMEELDRSIKEKCRQNHIMDLEPISDSLYYTNSECYKESQQEKVNVLKKMKK